MDEDKDEVYPKLALYPGNHFSYLIDIKKTTLNNLALIVYLFTIKRMLKKKKKNCLPNHLEALSCSYVKHSLIILILVG